MKTADSTESRDANDLFPVARIDAQDESYILPIREYLESHGVEVAVNRALDANPLYHIVAGDAGYVKQFFSREHARGTKRLGIVLGGGSRAVEFSGNFKIILASPSPMTSSEVVDAFEFFFTEGKKHLDLRRHHETRTVHEEVWPDETPAEQQERVDDARVSSIIADVFKEEGVTREHSLKHKKRGRRGGVQAWVLGALMGVGLLIIPTLWFGISMIVGGLAISSGARALRQGSGGAARWDARVAAYWIHQGAFVLNTVAVPLSWAGLEDIVRGQQRLVSFMRDTAQAETQAEELTMIAGRVASGLLNQVDATSTGMTAAADISELRVSLYTLGNTLGLAQAELSMLLADKTFPFSVPVLFTKGREAVGDLAQIRKAAGDIDKLLSLFLSLSGFKEPRTYLILLQNSMELRPTGGFIGSVAIASFADGRLTSLDIQDVYTFDGQLKGHVDPPTPVKELLGQEHWYLRDSNWDPDFHESGTRAAWFYEKETGTRVDGVIGISTPFIIELLRATGPVELTDYNDQITADNFYGKSIYYTQNDFFPGSTQKKDFLGSLARTMLTAITSGKNVNTTKLFHAITTALTSHDLVMMFSDPEIQSLVEHNAWAGRVPVDVGCRGTEENSCVFDPLVSVEANMGVNKVNYFVTRALDREITVNPDGTRTESATLVFHNSSDSENKGTSYRTYVRFVLPESSSVRTITLDGTPIPTRKGSGPPTIPFVETTTVASGHFTIGAAFDVPASAERKLTITYEETNPLIFGAGGGVLDAFIQKQPGVSGVRARTVIRYPEGWTAGIEEQHVVTGARDFIAKQGQLEYNTILVADDLTRIRFTKP